MSFLYNIVIGPLELILEFFFKLVQVITGNIGIAIISLSFIVTLLTLPLYIVAEKWQEKEREIQIKLKPGVDRIKKAFKGDEQYMILNTYYKQNHYHPIMALRSSFSLVIQIPFFIAAYHFLSKLTVLNGYSFLFIRDFGSPDSVFHIGNFSINILPIAMTIINCISGVLYSKGHSLREKIQIYVCALFFLVLLYNSPAGLVVYWTMNNILSLIKNIFYKIKNPKKAIYGTCSFVALISFILIFTKLKNIDILYKAGFILLDIVLISYPILIKYFNQFIEKFLDVLNKNPSNRCTIFVLSCLIMATLAGVVIPSILVQSQPDVYCYVDDYTSPAPFILITFSKALGIFFLWPLCFYALFSKKIKNVLTFVFFNAAFFAIINTFCFSGKYGSIQPTLIFMEPQKFWPTKIELFINIFVFILLLGTTLFLCNKKVILIKSFSIIVLLSLGCISLINCLSVNKEFSNMTPPQTTDKIEPVYHLSKTGKNVILFMQNACYTPLIPYILEDIQDLKEHFTGFTYYPNTTTLGSVTMTGSPGLFGGYEYTPFEINKRDDKSLQQKHNEALLTLPVLFHNEANYDVTVSNLPYENYSEEPLTAMYKDFPFVNRVTTRGTYSQIWYDKHNMERSPHTSFLIKRNFICFSIFKMVPPLLRSIIYSHEYWIAHDPYDEGSSFVDDYSALEFMPELFDFNAENNNFIMIDNETTHTDVYVDENEIPSLNPNEFSEDPFYKIQTAVLLKYAIFFDYLKENGVYDNTRIIIVSDHGRSLIEHSVPNIYHPRLVSTLLVKDFNCTTSFNNNNTFMTNADTPYMITKGIIENAKNPFTGNPLEIVNKQNYLKIAIPNSESTRIRHNKKFKIDSDKWITVHDNIYDTANWSKWQE